MKLWCIDFSSAMCHESGLYVLQSANEPTEDECLKALYENTYTGTIYFESVEEITEKELRYKKYTLMQKGK